MNLGLIWRIWVSWHISHTHADISRHFSNIPREMRTDSSRKRSFLFHWSVLWVSSGSYRLLLSVSLETLLILSSTGLFLMNMGLFWWIWVSFDEYGSLLLVPLEIFLILQPWDEGQIRQDSTNMCKHNYKRDSNNMKKELWLHIVIPQRWNEGYGREINRWNVRKETSKHDLYVNRDRQTLVSHCTFNIFKLTLCSYRTFYIFVLTLCLNRTFYVFILIRFPYCSREMKDKFVKKNNEFRSAQEASRNKEVRDCMS